MDFSNLIGSLARTSNIGFYVINLKRAVERLPIIKKLEEDLNIKLNYFEAADGHKLIAEGHPITCQDRGAPHTRGAGDIGCSVSHVNICKDAISKNYDAVFIFEDDCLFTSNVNTLESELEPFIINNEHWDLFLFGTSNIYATKTPYANLCRILQFNCTHACLLKRSFMQGLIQLYEDYYNGGFAYSIDGMYSKVLLKQELVAYGFNYNKFFIQKPGLYSYIIEGVR